MSIKFLTAPSKTLRNSITAAATSFQLNDIKGWDNQDLAAGDFGTEHYVIFRNATKTVIELMEIDPSTIASANITIVRRGLQFDGDLLTEVADNKRSWVKGDTFVDLGTVTSQTLQWLKEYIDATAIAGAPDASTTTKGIVKMSTAPASPSEPIAVGTNDTRVPTQGENDAMAAGGDFGTPGSGNKFITEEYVGDGVRTTYEFAGSPHTWTKKAGLKKVLVQIWGGGGSGAYIARTDGTAFGAYGGAGGGYAERWFAASELGATETITIGAGGAAVSGGGAGTNASASGNDGGNTTFGSHITAYGGGGGNNSSNGGSSFAADDASTNSDSGKSGVAGVNPTLPGLWGGGGGAYASSTESQDGGRAFYGGAGGGAARTGAVGAGGTSKLGGNGGAGARNSSGTATGVSGSVPAGGGGAAMTNNNFLATSGAGGNGRCIVTEFYA